MPASPAGYSINPVPPNSTANLPPTPLPAPAPARCDTRGKSRPIEHSALRDFELTLGVDTVEKVSAKKLWNSNLKRWNPGRFLTQDCVFVLGLESMLLRGPPQNPFSTA